MNQDDGQMEEGEKPPQEVKSIQSKKLHQVDNNEGSSNCFKLVYAKMYVIIIYIMPCITLVTTASLVMSTLKNFWFFFCTT